MKEGANLYGNGQNVLVSFLAVEREINQKGSVVSLPFPMNYSTQTDTDGQYITGVARPYYEGADGSKGVRLEGGGILRLATDNGTKIFDYDGSKRSDIDYDFSATNGDAWTDLTLVKGDTRKKANEGVLLIPAADVVSGSDGLYKDTDGDDIIDADSESKLIYRFTAQGEKWEDTIYVEYADRMYKDVVLGHYDDTDIDGGTTIKLPTDTLPGSNGTYIPGADFTPQENMGWNCIGIP